MEGEMKIIKIGLIVLAYMFFAGSSQAAELTPAKGDTFPDITLSMTEKASEKEYLGLSGKGSFRISQIKAELLILEIFSMYCPYCQKEAPIVNELYLIINKREDLKNKIRIIGVGAGNNTFEVDVFRNQYNIQFPLFSDEAYSVHKSVGEVRTPYFFVIKNTRDKKNTIIYSKVGSIQDPKQFLDKILEESGMK
jgi:peroxiredoxin